jgi:hypothetical protein
MRWALILLIAATIASFAFAAIGGESARAPSPCTWTGTPERDVKTGTAGANVLCAEPGNDFIHGAAGNDLLRAGKGRDVVVGGGGRDVLHGGRGRDRLFAVDDQGGERIIGGRGNDQCFVDPGDVVFGCEQTFRSNEPEMAGALGQSLRSVMEIVEEVTVSPTVAPPPVIVTSTITLPPCNQGPPEPPPFCGGG